MKRLLRFLRTVRHLKTRQVFARILLRLRRVKIHAATARPRASSGPWVPTIQRRSGLDGKSRLKILNKSIDLSDPDCWRDHRQSRLVLYNLHYLDVINADTCGDGNGERYELLERWVQQNPPTGGAGWEPYPLSLRIVNIIKWALNGGSVSASIAESLHHQAQALSQQVEHHILGNHILANAKALVFAGSYFDGRDAEKWLQEGSRLLESELDEQILADGGHFERSPMYQAILLEDVLDLTNLSRHYALGLTISLPEFAMKMQAWLQAMTHTDGDVSYFNDSTMGVAPSLQSLIDYAGRLDLRSGSDSNSPNAYLEASGYIRRSLDDVALIIDVGEIGPDYQPGHAHSDCLSFEMTCGRQRVLVNTGVSTYEEGERRNRERSTAAHNTVALDGAEQNEMWGAFRVGRRARPREIHVTDQEVKAQHDGFRTVGIVHQRRFSLSGSEVRIDDNLVARGSARARGTAYFHYHPSVDLAVKGNIVDFGVGKMIFSGYQELRSEQYDYCLGFNSVETGTRLAVVFQDTLRTEIRFPKPLAGR